MIKVKFKGVDEWSRPIFVDDSGNHYGSTDKLVACNDTPEMIREKIQPKDLTYFGDHFGCEPMGDPCVVEMTWEQYPYCRAVQDVLVKHCDFDPADYPGELGLALQAYDCSSGCIDESVWPIEELDRSIAAKFRLAIIGCMTVRGHAEGSYAIIVEPCYEDLTTFVVLDGKTGAVIMHGGDKAWRFGHDDGTLDDLEEFFAGLVETVPTADHVVNEVRPCEKETDQ